MFPSLNRVLIKISGELLAVGSEEIFNPEQLNKLAVEILELQKKIPQIVLVVGAGNMLRGSLMEAQGLDRVRSDYMGMMATVINAIALQDALLNAGGKADVLSSFFVPEIGELYSKHRADSLLDHGHIVICAGGTGNPYFSTDTAGALRAIELGCELYIKGTKVDGIYDKDPTIHADAKRYATMHFDDVLKQGLKVMDQAAFALCREHNLTLKICDMNTIENIGKAATEVDFGSLISNEVETVIAELQHKA